MQSLQNYTHTQVLIMKTSTEMDFEPLTDIQVRHGKIPTSVLQGPFLASVGELVGWGCSNAISADFRCNLRIKKNK